MPELQTYNNLNMPFKNCPPKKSYHSTGQHNRHVLVLHIADKTSATVDVHGRSSKVVLLAKIMVSANQANCLTPKKDY